ncbi:hypothetical protein [Alicycliphilus denitrificans]|uniref:hypothetical protein n=1 Tax=Alicycliphilus denitrificans TaxID=179636 RepID=UPI00384B374E
MHAQAITSVRWLLNELHDPFVMFPLQSIARSLSEVAAESQESFCAREGPYGVARKFWGVPMEMLHEEIGLLIGSAFVLGQATLTQSIAIVSQLHHLSGRKASILNRKHELLEIEATRDPETQMSHLVVIDTAANFFKHHHEWPRDWHLSSEKGVQAKTTANARTLGFSGHEITDNMHIALRRMGIDQSNMADIASTIQGWRERLAQKFSHELGEPIDW